jgi:hypothetical protein
VPGNSPGLIWDWGKSSEWGVSASTALAGGNEVRCREQRTVRSAVRRITERRQNSAAKAKGSELAPAPGRKSSTSCLGCTPGRRSALTPGTSASPRPSGVVVDVCHQVRLDPRYDQVRLFLRRLARQAIVERKSRERLRHLRRFNCCRAAIPRAGISADRPPRH